MSTIIASPAQPQPESESVTFGTLHEIPTASYPAWKDENGAWNLETVRIYPSRIDGELSVNISVGEDATLVLPVDEMRKVAIALFDAIAEAGTLKGA